MLNDKENLCPQLHGSFKNQQHQLLNESNIKSSFANSPVKRTRKPLLADAQKERLHEDDTRTAFELQTDEACAVVAQWMQEDEDEEFVESLSEKLGEEFHEESCVHGRKDFHYKLADLKTINGVDNDIRKEDLTEWNYVSDGKYLKTIIFTKYFQKLLT